MLKIANTYLFTSYSLLCYINNDGSGGKEVKQKMFKLYLPKHF